MSESIPARKTKIVCTLGPASHSPEMIRRLIQAGMNVARLNFSHGDFASHGQVIDQIRAISREMDRPVGILLDLPGPKIRLGELPEPVTLEAGSDIALAPGGVASPGVLPVQYPYLIEDTEEDQRILLADGLVELKVMAKKADRIICRVMAEGVVSSHKGVNLPASKLRISAFTEKDQASLAYGLEKGVDFVAMSFVRQKSDLEPVCQALKGCAKPGPMLIAKIEKPQAVDNFADILEVVDGVMVARGDLGVEMPLYQVPVIQKRLIEMSRMAGKAVITATQMLRSMVDNPRPTRAEVTDVANAVLDGTDAVMLSEESAVGHYPIEAVQTLDQVCQFTEPLLVQRNFLKDEVGMMDTDAAISRAACFIARDLGAAVIVASTSSGSTARRISRFRPAQPVLGLTPQEQTYRQLSLSWGVIPAMIEPYDDPDEMFESARSWILERRLATAGDRVVVTTGWPLNVSGTTNLVKVMELADMY